MNPWITRALGVRVRQQDGSLWILVRVMRGKGMYAHWHRRRQFEVVATNRLYRRGCYSEAVGIFSHMFPRIISRPMYRYVCIQGQSLEAPSFATALRGT
ncbi:hypothetical protein LCGC14_1376970 [marine sediment metagenome]|uniref:Uncharacterized protein n=1 Tax=marine sediment metagenome TaxID=412755 RepID=A0A0F9MJ23_9ZZZZ